MKAINLIRPIIPIIPEVEMPTAAIPFREKVLWTTCSLLIYMVCSNLPLYGVQRALSSDPFYWMRVILASNRGTLMELGVSPLVTTGMVMQLLAGAKVIDVNLDVKEDRVLFMAAQKVVGLFVTFAMAVAYVLSGTYGDVSAIGLGNAMLIVAQLTTAGWVLLMLDEMLQKGYGLGSGISLFIASHVSETIVWKAFSPITINTGRGTEFEGACLAFFHLIFVRRNKFQALSEALLRQNLPNLTSLMATCLVFVACIYMQGWRVNLTVKLQKARGMERPYPIKLFYTSNMPIILQTAFVSNIYFVSQMLYNQSPNSPFIKLIGEWAVTSPDSAAQYSVPVGGIAYYISPPASFSVLLHDPFHALFYLMFTLTACAVFGRTWTEVSGTSVRDVARQMRDNQVVMKGHRDTATAKILSRYIPIAAALGGICIGLLTVVADYMGERCKYSLLLPCDCSQSLIVALLSFITQAPSAVELEFCSRSRSFLIFTRPL
jgi:protein transport protein SEC61 subunit alpha